MRTVTAGKNRLGKKDRKFVEHTTLALRRLFLLKPLSKRQKKLVDRYFQAIHARWTEENHGPR